MGKNYSDNWHSIKNTDDLTMKQMFDISEKLITEQSDEIYGIRTINWSDSSWKYLSLIRDEQIINLQRAKVYVFSDSVLCLGKMNENPQSNIAWEGRVTWFKSSKEFRVLDRIDGEPMEFEWNLFPGFTTLQLCHKVQELLSRFECNTREFHRKDYLHVDVQRHRMGIKRQQCRMRVKCRSRFSICKKIWSKTMVISRTWFREKSGALLVKTVHKENGTKLQRK